MLKAGGQVGYDPPPHPPSPPPICPQRAHRKRRLATRWLQEKPAWRGSVGGSAAASELEMSLRAADPFPASRQIESLPRRTSDSRAPVSGRAPRPASLPTKRSPGDLAISRGTNRWMGMLTARNDGIIPQATKAGGDEEFLRSLRLSSVKVIPGQSFTK